MKNEETKIQAYKDILRKNMIEYTVKAFQMLPKVDKPNILDIGCGSGIPTLELVSLSDGQITGLDINQTLLNRLERKIKKAGLSARVKIINCSILDMDFPDESFDIIWAEGSVSAIGFDKGLTEWRRFIKKGGFLAIHDEVGNLAEKLKQIPRCGYDLLDHFILSEDIWWDGYYAPLEKKLDKIQAKSADDPETLAALDKDRMFIKTFKQDPKLYRSVFFIMKKSD